MSPGSDPAQVILSTLNCGQQELPSDSRIMAVAPVCKN